jgi:hypothetical protein
MNCLKPDHPCYAYTFPASIIEYGKTSPGPPFKHSVLASFVPFTSNYGFSSGKPFLAKGMKVRFRPLMTGSGRRFDTIGLRAGSSKVFV